MCNEEAWKRNIREMMEDVYTVDGYGLGELQMNKHGTFFEKHLNAKRK